MTREEFALLLIRRANLQEWIALLENKRWPGDSPQRSMKNVLAAYRKMLEDVDLALQKAPRVSSTRRPGGPERDGAKRVAVRAETFDPFLPLAEP